MYGNVIDHIIRDEPEHPNLGFASYEPRAPYYLASGFRSPRPDGHDMRVHYGYAHVYTQAYT